MTWARASGTNASLHAAAIIVVLSLALWVAIGGAVSLIAG
jgi:hypothetical protein